MTHFRHKSAADRYASARPYFHPVVIDHIRSFLQIHSPLSRALDVGCGTGMSTTALAAIADDVIGTDISSEMLALVPSHPNIQFIASPAESIPLPSNEFDLITTSLAFHWFDQSAFLTEAARLLHPLGWLVIYNNWFCGSTHDSDGFSAWFKNSYLIEYPSPPRHSQPLTDETISSHGFDYIRRDTFCNTISFSPHELVSYLITQSNVIAQVEEGSRSLDSVYSSLLTDVSPFFSTQRADFDFGGYIWYTQKCS